MLVLPVEQELLSGPQTNSDEDCDFDDYIEKMKVLKQGLYDNAHRNRKSSQIHRNIDYDKK